MKFVKMQGTGNDFVVIEPADISRDWPRLAIALCDRHYGIGADGVLLLLPSQAADFRMRIFNPDGSEAESCGNGTRCIVKYFVDRKLGSSGEREITVETVGGIRKAVVHESAGKGTIVTVGMGEPRFRESEIPAVLERGGGKVLRIIPLVSYSLRIEDRQLNLELVSMGNPHAVYFTDKSLNEFPLSALGPKVERHPLFPKGTNFEVARVVSRKEIEAVVWERGAGVTLACGSGACAVAVAARLNGNVDDKVSVGLPGGTLEIEWPGWGEVLLSGPAETVFTGEWPDEGSD